MPTGYRARMHGREPITAGTAAAPIQVRFAKVSLTAGSPARPRGGTRPVASKRERQRQLARARYQRQQERRMQRVHKTRTRAIVTGAVGVLAAIGVGGYFLFGAGGGKSAAASPSA